MRWREYLPGMGITFITRSHQQCFDKEMPALNIMERKLFPFKVILYKVAYIFM
jgi:hypothetical protein